MQRERKEKGLVEEVKSFSLRQSFDNPRRLGARRAGALRLAYHFEGTEPPGFFEPPRTPGQSSRQYRNPIALAREWQRMLDNGECATQADVARRLGVTRARVTQVLKLLELAPEVLDFIVALGNPLPRPVISERMLRPVLNLPTKEQRYAVKDILEIPASAAWRLHVGNRAHLS